MISRLRSALLLGSALIVGGIWGCSDDSRNDAGKMEPSKPAGAMDKIEPSKPAGAMDKMEPSKPAGAMDKIEKGKME